MGGPASLLLHHVSPPPGIARRPVLRGLGPELVAKPQSVNRPCGPLPSSSAIFVYQHHFPLQSPSFPFTAVWSWLSFTTAIPRLDGAPTLTLLLMLFFHHRYSLPKWCSSNRVPYCSFFSFITRTLCSWFPSTTAAPPRRCSGTVARCTVRGSRSPPALATLCPDDVNVQAAPLA